MVGLDGSAIACAYMSSLTYASIATMLTYKASGVR
jgi:hypothetical protein